MWIFRTVTALTGRGEAGRIGDGDVVTATTRQSLVSAMQRKGRLTIVIESPKRPAIGVVAGCTAGAQASIVSVAVPVALLTIRGGAVESSARVTVLTGYGSV